MDFRLLGPFEVVGGGRVLTLGGAKQRALFARLLLHPNEALTDRLIDELLGQEPPPAAMKVVQVYVSPLRKALDRAGERPAIVTQPPGHGAHVGSDQIDARFERLLDNARRASGLVRDALRLWRGPALAVFACEPFAQTAIAQARAAPTLFVRRGMRPGGLSPADELTRFTWSIAAPAR